MNEYTDEITITSGHDEIWAYLAKDEDYEKVTEANLEAIFSLGWRWDNEFEGFAKFI